MPAMLDPNDSISKSDLAKLMSKDANAATGKVIASLISGVPMLEFVDPAVVRSNWNRYVDTVEKFNKPSEFTTSVSWE